MEVGKDLNDPDIRVKFIAGLTLDNQKEFIRFGVKKPLTEIVAHLKRHDFAFEISGYRFGNKVQDNDSVLLFYENVKKYNALFNLGKERLNMILFRG